MQLLKVRTMQSWPSKANSLWWRRESVKNQPRKIMEDLRSHGCLCAVYDPHSMILAEVEGYVPNPIDHLQVELQRQSWLVAAAARKMRSMHQAWHGMAQFRTYRLSDCHTADIGKPPWQPSGRSLTVLYS